ncbi:hypothetical protein N7462_009767 [Penicillium macrosclerotiorum]|uniref:uncharacterized protein n=1 Tax=Penicillium macrosclerotiorum TaxID=303699 RepID=UPI002548E29C|nr:uncharacterized protein N7462_009767 [Penicillium macrosclerotiorum]KAJ5668697.1 hypothetical protein N7462_009767 [Penicillium macrosclerotiorum]
MSHPSLKITLSDISDFSDLSTSVSSQNLEYHLIHKNEFEKRLEDYQYLSLNDDTCKILTATCKYLLSDGQRNLMTDVLGAKNDEELQQLAQSIQTGILQPMLANGAQTPIPSPRPGLEDSIEALDAQYADPASRDYQPILRAHCLKRDGFSCVFSGAIDPDHQTHKDQKSAPLEAAHIIPFSLGHWATDHERHQKSQIWVNILRFFPALSRRLERQHGNLDEDFNCINKEENMIMMVAPLHVEFGKFHFILEQTASENRYTVKRFNNFAKLCEIFLSETVSFSSHNTSYALPSPELIALHAAVGNILHASGQAEKIEKLLRDLADTRTIAWDGSTNLGALLSVSQLSLYTSDPFAGTGKRSTKSEEHPRPQLGTLAGSENERPKIQD